VVLTDNSFQSHIFQLDAFHNRHETLTLFVHKRALEKKVVVGTSAATAVK